jgi:hypothetical protein
MSAGSILPGQVGIFVVIPADSTGSRQAATGTVKIDNYAQAYVVGTRNLDEYMLVPKLVIPAGQSVTVTCDFSAKASDGSAIADFQVSFVLMGAAAPPLATQLILKSSASVDKTSVIVPSDPSSDTVPLNSVAIPPPPPPPPPPTPPV